MLLRATYRFFQRKFGRGHELREELEPRSTDKSEHWRWLLALSVCLAVPVLLETLDYTVVATAQPHIALMLLPSYIGTVYLLTSTAFLPLFASLSDVFGRHFALQLSLFIFMIGSAISTGALNIETMLVGRAVAGVGAVGLLTIVRVIISDSRSLDSSNWQTTLLFFLYTIGYVISPVIGGALVGISFRWIFAINLPCRTVSMILPLILLRNKLKDRQAAAWNSAKVIVCFVLGGLFISACLFWEWFLESQRTDTAKVNLSAMFLAEPMIPLAIFTSYDMCAVLAASFVSGMVMIDMLYFVAIFMTIATGSSATNAGVQLLYFAPGMASDLLNHCHVLSIADPKYPILFAIGPLAIHARFSQPAERLAIVSAMLLFFRSLGGTIGLAQCAAVLNAKVRLYLQDAVTSGAVSAEHAAALASIAGIGGLGSIQEIDVLSPEVQELVRNGFRKGVKWAFISLIPWAVVAFTLTVFLTNIGGRDSEEEPEVPKREEHHLRPISPRSDNWC
ncbi:MFS general substrate transporter [Pleurotus eryngii]|uniref:MFS general substrate transporter n=1 Tax=Pleurotus eryngii TaxID=5323 RepID=A0A9P6D9R1_PLEER|nr:MFS general substrate transporter [Pleurotus eryngii]